MPLTVRDSPNTPFDYNGDGVFTKEDLVQVDYDVNGDGRD